jgi:hypothetical protein
MTFRLTCIYSLLVIGLLACAGPEKRETEQAIEQETKDEATLEDDQLELTTNQAKRAFLEEVLAKDRAVRMGSEEGRIIVKHGYGSAELYEYRKAQSDQDLANFESIGAYLEAYGYPKKDSLGKDATLTPYLVIHHQTDPGKRNQYFNYLYQAYQTGQISNRDFEKYLDRTYQILYRSIFDFGSDSLKTDEKIEMLMEEMKLVQ